MNDLLDREWFAVAKGICSSNNTNINPEAVLILIVDDSSSVRAMLKSVLQREGYRVVEADNGEQALTICQHEIPDIVLVDAFMPVLDGFNTCTRLQQLPGWDNTPIIIITALSDDESIICAFEAGATDFITKPVNMITLHYRVRILLQARRVEAALRESERKYYLLLNTIKSPIIALDRGLTILYSNNACDRLIGCSADEAQGKKLVEIFPSVVSASWYAALFQTINTGKPQVVEEVVDDHRCLHVLVYPIQWGLLVILQDVSERKRAEKILVHLNHVLEKRVKARTTELVETNISLEREIAEHKHTEQKLRQSYTELHRTLEGTVSALSTVVEKRDSYTAGHQRRVADLACAISRELGLNTEQIEGIRIAGTLHDIGKIDVPIDILSKSSRLSNVEMALVKTHPQVGSEILVPIPFRGPIVKTVLQHHERLDGSGYPAALTGDNILLEARIIGVADVVEAISSHRPYRAALGLEVALDEIQKNAGILYDSEVVEACLKVFNSGQFQFK